MPSEDSLRKFGEQIESLNTPLNKAAIHKDQLNDEFVPVADLQEILNHEVFHRLFQCRVTAASDNEGLSKAVEDAHALYLKTTATLISTSDYKNLADLFDYLLTKERQGLFSKLLDKRLPLSVSAAQDWLGPGWGKFFHWTQFRFCAVEFEEGTDHRLAANARLPIVRGKEKGRGAVGTVHEVTVARGHWTDEKGVSNSKHERRLAQKVFNVVGASSELENERKFREELQKLKDLRAVPTTHKNINYHLASLEHGEEHMQRYSLFYELAEESLDRVLASEAHPKEWDWSKKFTVMENATDILHALGWLHKFRPDCAVYHFDVSPRNILVFTVNGRTVWKLSDFDLSEFQFKKDWYSKSISSLTWHHSDNSSVHCAQDPSSYRAPEVFREGKVGPESDVWSFACILSLVLSYLHGGAGAVLDFHKARRRPGRQGEEIVDYFYEQGDTHGQSGGVHPSVEEEFRKLKEEQGCLHHAKYVTKVTERLLKNVFDERDKKKRITADNLYTILDYELKCYRRAHEKEIAETKEELTTFAYNGNAPGGIALGTAQSSGSSQLNASHNRSPATSSSGINEKRPALSSPALPHTGSSSQSHTAISVPIRSPASPPLTPTQSRDISESPSRQAPLESEARPRHSSSLNISMLSPPEAPDIATVQPELSVGSVPWTCTPFCSNANRNTLADLLKDSTRDLSATCRGCVLSPLQHAAYCSDTAVLRHLIEKVPGIDLEKPCASGRTLLMQCCYDKKVDSAITLKEMGARLDTAEFKDMEDRVPRRLWNAFRKYLK